MSLSEYECIEMKDCAFIVFT